MKMISTNKHIKADWEGNNAVLTLQLSILIFSDEKSIHYAYLPALDLTGYGKSETEAKKSLKIVLHEYLDYTTKHNTLVKDLERHGWIVKKGKQVQPPDWATLIGKNKEFNALVSSNRNFYKTEQSVSIPAFA